MEKGLWFWLLVMVGVLSVGNNSTPVPPLLPGKGKRLVVLHTGTSGKGFKEGCDLVFEAKRTDGDNHHETNGTTSAQSTTPAPDSNVTCEANVDENGNEVEYSVKCVTVKEDAGEVEVVITRTTNKGVARLDYCINPKQVLNFLAIKKLKGRVFFKDGERTATIKVPVKNNNVKAADEVHIVRISKPTTGKVKKEKAEIIVLDDD